MTDFVEFMQAYTNPEETQKYLAGVFSNNAATVFNGDKQTLEKTSAKLHSAMQQACLHTIMDTSNEFAKTRREQLASDLRTIIENRVHIKRDAQITSRDIVENAVNDLYDPLVQKARQLKNHAGLSNILSD